MADDAVDLGVDQLLRGGGALLRIGGVVFGEQFELDLLPPIVTPLALSLIDGHAGAVCCPLPRWAMRAAGGADVADLDDHVLEPTGAW